MQKVIDVSKPYKSIYGTDQKKTIQEKIREKIAARRQNSQVTKTKPVTGRRPELKLALEKRVNFSNKKLVEAVAVLKKLKAKVKEMTEVYDENKDLEAVAEMIDTVEDKMMDSTEGMVPEGTGAEMLPEMHDEEYKGMKRAERKEAIRKQIENVIVEKKKEDEEKPADPDADFEASEIDSAIGMGDDEDGENLPSGLEGADVEGALFTGCIPVGMEAGDELEVMAPTFDDEEGLPEEPPAEGEEEGSKK